MGTDVGAGVGVAVGVDIDIRIELSSLTALTRTPCAFVVVKMEAIFVLKILP